GVMEPTVWSVEDARAVIAVFKSAVKQHGQNHTVDIDVDGDRHVTVRETPALFDAGSELTFTGWDPADYPYSRITDALGSGVADDAGQREAPANLTSWSGTAMRAVLAVEKRRGADLRLWKLPGTGRHLAQIGDEWRGFIFARRVDPDAVDVVEPTADLNVEAGDEVQAESPEAMSAWSERLRKALGIEAPGGGEQQELPTDGDDTDPRPEYGDYDDDPEGTRRRPHVQPQPRRGAGEGREPVRGPPVGRAGDPDAGGVDPADRHGRGAHAPRRDRRRCAPRPRLHEPADPRRRRRDRCGLMPGHHVYPVANCRGCRARIIWATVDPELKSARTIPVDADPHPKGTLILARDPSIPHEKDTAVVIRATKMRPGQIAGARAAGWEFYRLHSETCPKA
ncbi:hypothetical protein GWI33_010003, partial [Rhynchophorus ferrugineus]